MESDFVAAKTACEHRCRVEAECPVADVVAPRGRKNGEKCEVAEGGYIDW